MRTFILLAVMLLLAGCATKEKCSSFALRLVADENAVIDPTLYENVPVAINRARKPELLWVLRQPELDGRYIENAFTTKSQPLFTPQQMELMKKNSRMKPVDPELEKAFTTGGQPEINIKFNNPTKLAEVTTRNIDKRMAMFLDGVVLMAPVIREALTTGDAKISGKWSDEEASRIVNRLNLLRSCK